MSTYDELCELYTRARTRANERRERAAAVFSQAGERIVRRLGVPEGAYRWLPVEYEPEKNAPAASLVETMNAEDDGTWHVGMEIVLRACQAPESTFPVFFSLGVREEGDHFVVSLADGDAGTRLHPGDDDALDALAAEAERRLREWLLENLDRVLGIAPPGKEFGLYL